MVARSQNQTTREPTTAGEENNDKPSKWTQTVIRKTKHTSGDGREEEEAEKK